MFVDLTAKMISLRQERHEVALLTERIAGENQGKEISPTR